MINKQVQTIYGTLASCPRLFFPTRHTTKEAPLLCGLQ